LPASFLLMGFARHVERRAWPFVVAGLIALLSLAAIAMTAGAATVVAAGVLGFADGSAFALGLTLPPLLSTPQEVARVSAAMFTISYGITVVVAIICGAAWDATGIVQFAFLPIALAALPFILLPPTIKFNRPPSADA
jgi:cyanate permease